MHCRHLRGSGNIFGGGGGGVPGIIVYAGGGGGVSEAFFCIFTISINLMCKLQPAHLQSRYSTCYVIKRLSAT